MKDSFIEISSRLKQARIACGHRSARSFALKNNLPYITYSQHEAGKRKINTETIIVYAEKLNVDPAWLFTGKTFTYEADIYSQDLSKVNNKSELIKPELLINIFDELKKILLSVDINLSDRDKILISAEIYNKTCSSNETNISINSLLDMVLHFIKQILSNKVA